MPTIQPGGTASDIRVLVTGANGFVAAWLVRTLLERGYSVRGAVRSADKGEYLLEMFKEYGEKFEVVVVEDITKDDAFDEAVKDVHAIEHTASPVSLNADDPQELIGPAVKGTLGILQSALKNGSSIRRIVITSSTAAIGHRIPSATGEPVVFSEVDFNDAAIAEVEKLGREATPFSKYRASKTLAEKAAWKFYEENRGKVGWELVVINPPYVFGPPIHDIPTPSSMNESTRMWYDAIINPDSAGKSSQFKSTAGAPWVDVRDLAEAHVQALEKEEAGGERIFIAAGRYVWQDWLDTANSITPSPIPSHTLPRGVPGSGASAADVFQFDTAKEKRILGIRFRSMEEATRDTLEYFEGRGW